MIITLLRKPLEGSVAENTLKHGCGAINIDATRVSFGNESINFEARQKQQADPREKGWSGHVAQVGSDIQMYKEKGRWPANFILTHKDDCELKGTKRVKSPSGRGAVKKESSAEKLGNQGSAYSKESRKEGTVMICHVGVDGKEEIDNWICEEGCPVKTLDRQSGISKSTGGRIGNADMANFIYGGGKGLKDPFRKGDPGFGDTGGASRFFKQFKTENDQ